MRLFMRQLQLVLGLGLLAATSSPAQDLATSMRKCVDGKGQVTYTNSDCEAGEHPDERFRPPKPRPMSEAFDSAADEVPVVEAPPAIEVEEPAPQPEPLPQQVQVIQAPAVAPAPEVIYVPVGGYPWYGSAYNRGPRPGPGHWPGPPYRQASPPRPATHISPTAGSWEFNNRENSLYRSDGFHR